MSGQFRRHWVFALLAGIILFSAVIRLRLAELPLERDEGEYAYAGQLLLRGVPPYLQAYNMKLPGVYAAYALIMAIFGETPAGIHMGFILVNGLSILLLFLLARQLLDSSAGLAAAASFAILTLDPAVLGAAAHATHLVMLPTLGGLLLLWKGVETSKRSALVCSGLLFGLAFLMKQPGIFFIVFGAVYLFWTELQRRPAERAKGLIRMTAFAVATIVPFAITCLLLLFAGVFNKFWFWTFTYASEYVSEVSRAAGSQNFLRTIRVVVGTSFWMWILAGVGLVLVWVRRERRLTATFVTGFLIVSLLAVCPGFFFRRHYFILALPAISLAAGAAFTFLCRSLNEKHLALQSTAPIIALVACLGYPLYLNADYLFKLPPNVISRALYQRNPNAESIEVAKYIKADSTPADRIAVIGSEPQIYFYADRRSATGYIYTYGLMEGHRYALQMQQEMIAEIEAARPKYLVYVDVTASWLRRATSQMLIFEWLARYKEGYDLVGVVDILTTGPSIYRWGTDAQKYVPVSDSVLYVYKLKT